MKKKDIRNQIQSPRKEARGKTRWWWYGCAVERQELIRELDYMQEAGLGGVELQILYPLEADDEKRGIENVDYMSPEYLELINFAADEAKKRDMQFDLTLGSSWPFGGPFMSEELAGQNVLPFSMDVQGPCRFSKDLTTVLYGRVVGAVLGKMDGDEMLPETIVDISEKITDKYLFNWPWGTEIGEIDVPEGTHKIVLFVSSDKKQRVLKPLRGGDGLIVDHNRKESLRMFLEYAGDPITEAVGEGKIANYFCDSIEVFGHNWTEILYDEFKKRRGYDLHPYIYALWGKIQGMTEQVRYDYQKTMAELTVENFFEELTAWSHEKGALSRIQAHGTWGDVLKAYGAADIPEGETFSAFDRYEVNTIHRKLAVSAGHVYHKPVISNESFTWLRFPRFVVSLENIIEVFGHNWTEILYDEFKKRRGYDLHPYIYALWGKIQGMTEQVRYDYQKTMAELTVENFFEELTAWSHEKGALSRIQAHGTWGDVLKAYGAADIPEGETFSAFDRYEVNTIHRKLAVSAGHVYHKPVISNESFTWLRFPRFVVSLENIKAAADSIFLDGINQIVNHGYSYSHPVEAKETMLAFYASSNINHTNTWWKDYPKVSRYINRVCDFMQRGHMVVNMAVYLPQHDIWAETPLADTHMCMKLDERLESACINGIHKAGFWFDYVNDEVLEHWEDYGYDTLLLIECDRIPVKTMERIESFAESGNTVIAANRLPHKSCGLKAYKENSQKVQEIGNRMLEKKQVTVTADKFQSLVEEISKKKVPDVKIQNHSDVIGYVHRKDEGEDIYFISNISPEERKERICFHGQPGNFCVFDPMTGEEKGIYARERKDGSTEVALCLEGFQSLLFVFSEEMEEPLLTKEKEQRELLNLSGKWTLSVQEKNFSKEQKQAESWEREPELRFYSGIGTYSKTFCISKEQWEESREAERVLLQLEHVGETAEIFVNGKYVDTLIKRPYCADITGFLQKGENHVCVNVANLLINRMIDPDYPEPKAAKNMRQWPYATGGLEQCRQERLYNWREREMIQEPLPSGLWGNVCIVTEKDNE